jgi:succinylarginine dihydrolase
MTYYEVNFDGLVGPNHNYAGLAEGNLASSQNSHMTSFPKKAALQGLQKMKILSDHGLKQAIIPPQQRPDLSALRKLGFTGKPQRIIAKCAQQSPELLAEIYSSSSMWTANCATVSPSCDTIDQKLHLTPANLNAHFHRSLEADFSYKALKVIFNSKKHFNVHSPLPACENFADEGAANHMRLSSDSLNSGLELFVYGKSTANKQTTIYNARHHLNASKAIIRRHLLNDKNSITIQQNPKVIDQGVFHNDVIATSNGDFLFTHEQAFSNQAKTLDKIRQQFYTLTNSELIIKNVGTNEISVKEAIQSYLFNTQIISQPNNNMLMIAPEECRESNAAKNIINSMINDNSNPLSNVKYVDLRQSMSNGGGPACLRLRIPMNNEEFKAIHQGFILTQELYQSLEKWINKHYRETLTPAELADPLLYQEILLALDELSQILQAPKLYPFQN